MSELAELVFLTKIIVVLDLLILVGAAYALLSQLKVIREIRDILKSK